MQIVKQMGEIIMKYGIYLAIVVIIIACTKSPEMVTETQIQRIGKVVALKPDKFEKFKESYNAALPDIQKELSNYHIRNYSIYLKDLDENKPYLFGYYDYTGDNYEADRKKMLTNQKIKDWETMVGAECFIPISKDNGNAGWVNMEQVFYFDGMIASDVNESKVQRLASVIGLRPEMKDSYVLLHKYTWPEILTKIKEGNIRHYSIYLHELDSKLYLFGYFEYVGNNFNADMAHIDGDPATIAWMKFTDTGCQLPIPTRAEGEWWANMDQVFYFK